MFDRTPASPPRDYLYLAETAHDFLAGQSDFSPRNQKLNTRLSQFVTETLKPRSADEVKEILQSPRLQGITPSLRKLLSRAEYEMEVYTAESIAGIEKKPVDPRYASYGGFLYRGQYEALINSEMRAMGWPHKQPVLDREHGSLAFVGAGPLPISAIMLYAKTGIPVTCIDSDKAAVELGRQVIQEVGKTTKGLEDLAKKVHYVQADGDKFDYLSTKIVIVASLVEGKDAVVSRIINTAQTVSMLVTRSARNLSTLLYEPYEAVGGEEFLNLYPNMKPYNTSDADEKSVNTSLVWKFPGSKIMARNKVDPNDVSSYTNDAQCIRTVGNRRRRSDVDAGPPI